tara:strand:- start:230 stop:568 length:339 start_codon:yes stop_codon:yes gene_type:complete
MSIARESYITNPCIDIHIQQDEGQMNKKPREFVTCSTEEQFLFIKRVISDLEVSHEEDFYEKTLTGIMYTASVPALLEICLAAGYTTQIVESPADMINCWLMDIQKNNEEWA